VYQDDVLLTAITLGGYSWLEADTLRKAMGKKIPAEMEAQKEKLLKGFREYGKLSKEKAERSGSSSSRSPPTDSTKRTRQATERSRTRPRT
jgi:hypothetical protein